MMVADIFTALAEDRPYRKKMDRDKITKILKDFSGRGLMDVRIIELLLDNYDEAYNRVTATQRVAKDLYDSRYAKPVMN